MCISQIFVKSEIVVEVDTRSRHCSSFRYTQHIGNHKKEKHNQPNQKQYQDSIAIASACRHRTEGGIARGRSLKT